VFARASLKPGAGICDPLWGHCAVPARRVVFVVGVGDVAVGDGRGFAEVLRRAARGCAFWRIPRVFARASLDPGLIYVTRFGVIAPFRRGV
jgi:hypothetical protein